MANIFKGENWDVVATRRAKELAVKNGRPEDMWELFLMLANKQMLQEIIEETNEGKHAVTCNLYHRWRDDGKFLPENYGKEGFSWKCTCGFDKGGKDGQNHK
ncbi:MAG: hypothetical protein WC208_14100 [Gallionella sp.]|jgi:hypothetical protein